MWACFYCPISKILYFFRSDDVNDVQEVINKESILPLLAAATTITTRFNTMTCTITCPSHVCGQLFSLLVVVDHVLPYENQITCIFMGRCPLINIQRLIVRSDAFVHERKTCVNLLILKIYGRLTRGK